MFRMLGGILVLCIACSGGTEGGNMEQGGPLDPNMPPVQQGDWYRPVVATTWQWQLQMTVDTSPVADVYDIDLFDSDVSLIAALQASGHKVICYFSAGSSEDWRPDFSALDAAVLGKNLGAWAGERWLDIRSANVREIMLSRLDLARQKGCDGVEPDNVDGFTNDTGFPLTASDQLAFNRYLANQAHLRVLTVGLKNSGDQADALVDYYDFSLNEQCHQFDECDQLAPFSAQGKPIFNAEYADSLAEARSRAVTICPAARAKNLRTLFLPLDLDGSFRLSCDDQ